MCASKQNKSKICNKKLILIVYFLLMVWYSLSLLKIFLENAICIICIICINCYRAAPWLNVRGQGLGWGSRCRSGRQHISWGSIAIKTCSSSFFFSVLLFSLLFFPSSSFSIFPPLPPLWSRSLILKMQFLFPIYLPGNEHSFNNNYIF